MTRKPKTRADVRKKSIAQKNIYSSFDIFWRQSPNWTCHHD